MLLFNIENQKKRTLSEGNFLSALQKSQESRSLDFYPDNTMPEPDYDSTTDDSYEA